MLSAKIQDLLTNQNKHEWLVTGSKLNPYQKSRLIASGISLRKYTGILFNDLDPKVSEFLNLSKILEIDPVNLIK